MQNNLKFNIVFSLVFIFIGIFLLSMNFINEKRDDVFGYVNLKITEESNKNVNIDSNVELILDEEQSDTDGNNIVEDINYEYYLAVLKIPKIDLNRGFYDKNSSLNNLNYNIKMLNESSYPDEKNGNVILAAHSGNYYNSYFGNLWKLEIGDYAYLYYKNAEYKYQIINIYTDLKDGDVVVKRNPYKDTLTLITCTKDDETTQTLYILEKI